jgi:hypothetical protein
MKQFHLFAQLNKHLMYTTMQSLWDVFLKLEKKKSAFVSRFVPFVAHASDTERAFYCRVEYELPSALTMPESFMKDNLHKSIFIVVNDG